MGAKRVWYPTWKSDKAKAIFVCIWLKNKNCLAMGVQEIGGGKDFTNSSSDNNDDNSTCSIPHNHFLL